MVPSAVLEPLSGEGTGHARHPGGDTHLCPPSLQVPMGRQPSQRSGAVLGAELSGLGEL